MGLFVRSFGPAQAPTIVLLHAGGVSGWTWEPAVECLPDFHCLVPDLPEHGQSPSVDRFSIAGAARQVAELIETQSHGGQASVVGQSLGAQVALQLLADQPGLVQRAVVSSALVRSIPGVWMVPTLLRLYAPIRDVVPLVWLNARACGVPRGYFRQFRDDTRRLRREGLGRVLRENYRFRIPTGLREAETPTLILAGERESQLVQRSARDLADVLPRGEARLAMGMRHNWPLQTPGRFAQTVRAWLRDEPLPKWLAPML